MLTRVADSIFWMNRYIERMENNSRIIDVNLLISMELPTGTMEQWGPLVHATGEYPLFEKLYGEPTKENVLKFLLAEKENSSSILNCLHFARENARIVRENISSEIWEHLNVSYLEVREMLQNDDVDILNIRDFLKKIKFIGQLFAGLIASTISRLEGWSFSIMGRYLERADNASRFLDVKYFHLLPSPEDVGSSLDLIQWHSILKSLSAFEMYRKIYGRISAADITEFIVLNHDFPRSILFCVLMLDAEMRKLTGSGINQFSNEAERKIGKLKADLSYTSVSEIVKYGLHEYLDLLQRRLIEIGGEIDRSFLISSGETV